MGKRRKKPQPLDPVTALPFSGYDLVSARPASTAKPSRSAKHALQPAPDDAPIPRAPTPTNASPFDSRSTARRPSVRVRPAAPGACPALLIAEIERMAARWLPILPAPVTFIAEACVTAAESVTFVVTTCAEDYEHARELGLVVLHGAEFAALTLAAELDRLTPSSFEHWLASKQATPTFELTPHVTLGVYLSRHDQHVLSVHSVLHACGALMVAVASATPAPTTFWENHRAA